MGIDRTTVGGSDYGLRWRFALIGLITCAVWLAVQTTVAAKIPPALLSARLTLTHGVGLIWLLMALLISAQLMKIKLSDLLGDGKQSAWIFGLVCVVALYAIHFAYATASGEPEEPYMATLFAGMTGWEVTIFLITIFAIVPVAEELVFRHFLLGVLPFRRSKWWAGAATLLTAFVFAIVHSQYKYASTHLLLFLLACSLAVARVATGGLALPMAMHSVAAMLAVAFAQLR